MTKKLCDNCEKNITKSVPGVECSKCERLFHFNSKCTGLTNKQIAAVKAAPSLEWSCLQCQSEMPRRNSSIIVPSDDDDRDEDGMVEVNSKKLLGEIAKEVERAIRKEMRELNQALEFQSSKMDEVMECIEIFKNTIKDLEQKNKALTNKNANLEIRIGAMEQRMQVLEQEKLQKFIEISNVPTENDEEMNRVVENLAAVINQPKEGIKNTKRLQSRKDLPSKIIVELRDEDTQEKWIMESKKIKLCVADIHPTRKNTKDAIYVREAMTQTNKQLLWNAKQELKFKQNFKYVWFKKGYVKARRDDNEKIYNIRSMEDIQAINIKKA